METQCIQEQLAFQQLGRREVIGRFDGGAISSDAGGVLLRQVENGCGILKRVAGCFRDYRDPQRIEHGVEELIKQRIYALALGYEDPTAARYVTDALRSPYNLRPVFRRAQHS